MQDELASNKILSCLISLALPIFCLSIQYFQPTNNKATSKTMKKKNAKKLDIFIWYTM